jgi:hypothetical protein
VPHLTVPIAINETSKILEIEYIVRFVGIAYNGMELYSAGLLEFCCFSPYSLVK